MLAVRPLGNMGDHMLRGPRSIAVFLGGEVHAGGGVEHQFEIITILSCINSLDGAVVAVLQGIPWYMKVQAAQMARQRFANPPVPLIVLQPLEV